MSLHQSRSLFTYSKATLHLAQNLKTYYNGWHLNEYPEESKAWIYPPEQYLFHDTRWGVIQFLKLATKFTIIGIWMLSKTV
jgi:hypothetical protein